MIHDESVKQLVAPAGGSLRLISATASAGMSERAQNLKLRRSTNGAKRAVVQLAIATEPQPAPAEEQAIAPKQSNNTRKTDRQAAARQPAKVIPVVKYETITARSPIQPEPEVDVFSDPFGDETEVSLKPAVVKPGMTIKSASKAAQAALQAIEDNPFGDEEPLERIVRQPANGRSGSENQIPTFEENLAQGPQARLAPCPSPSELKKIREIKADIVSKSTDLPPECTLGDAVYQPRQFAATTYHWKASALCHKPLYFEDVSLERYGHSWGPVLQPLVSGGKFFLTLPILPYEMGIEPPCECVYVLGYYRPGSCAPYMIFPVPLSIRGGLAEAGAVMGAVFLIP